MDENKLHDKLDKIDSRLGLIDVHLAKYNEQLVYHIDRTDRLEAFVTEAVVPLQEDLQNRQGARKLVANLFTAIGVICTAIGTVVAALTYWIRH